METKELISSYDVINDTFVCKISDKNGYYANYDLDNGIFLNIDENRLPVSVYIDNASDVLNVGKKILEDPNVSIFIESRNDRINFRLCIADKEIYTNDSWNIFGIPEISYIIKVN